MRPRPRCTTIRSALQGKADGLYLDTLAPGHAAMEGFANSTLAKGELDSAYITRVAAAYRSYVRCAGGIANRLSCPAKQVFDVPSKSCISYESEAAPASATLGSSPPPAPGRRQLPGGG